MALESPVGPKRSAGQSGAWRKALLATIAWASVLACHEGPTAPAPLLRLPRALSADERQIVDGSNGFAWTLLTTAATAAGPDSNVFLSPLSASMALGMATSGAAGATLDSMQHVLGFAGLPVTDMASAYHSLLDLLLSLDSRVDFRIANAIWYDQSLSVLPSFAKTATTDFDARIAAAAFDDPATVGVINAWVDSSTAGRIPTLLQSIPPGTVMFLLNAIHFHGNWTQQFDLRHTRDSLFTTRTGATVPVSFMHGLIDARWARGPGFTAVDLGYGRAAYAMTLLVPDAGLPLDSLGRALRDGAWSAVSRTLSDSFSAMPVDVTMPKFRVSWGDDLVGPLTTMGMGIAFSDRADFSNISGDGPLFINEVLQKTWIDVDEEGTTAAAATGVGVGLTDIATPPLVRADHPFIYLIRERLSGTILFVGAFCHPPT